MEEIAQNIFIEQMYPGLTIGALKFQDRLFLVDAPPRKDELLSWRKKLLALGGPYRTMLLMLDTNLDRTLGLHRLDAVTLAHENAIEIINKRASSARLPDLFDGADCNPGDVPDTIEWIEPDITYSTSISVHWDETPLVVTHQAGSHTAGSWLRYDAEKVIFVGDSVMTQQPPFLARGDLDQWLSDLIWLRTGTFSDYTIISSRQGIVNHETIEQMIGLITETKSLVEALVEEGEQSANIPATALTLLKRMKLDKESTAHFQDRVIWGLENYLRHHTSTSTTEDYGVKK